VTEEEAEAFLKIDDVNKDESNNMDVDAEEEPSLDDMVKFHFMQLLQIHYPLSKWFSTLGRLW
jgi:hypothetical protein